MSDRPCTCHPDDNPPTPCMRGYALGECQMAAEAVENLRAYATDIHVNHLTWDDAGVCLELIDRLTGKGVA